MLRVEARRARDVRERETERAANPGACLTGSHDRRRRDRQQHDAAATSARHRRILATADRSLWCRQLNGSLVVSAARRYGARRRALCELAPSLPQRRRAAAARARADSAPARCSDARRTASRNLRDGAGDSSSCRRRSSPALTAKTDACASALTLFSRCGFGERLRGARAVVRRGQHLAEAV